MACALVDAPDEGLPEFRSGRGVTVAGTPETSTVIEGAGSLLEYARHRGYRKEELVEFLGQLP